MTHSVHAFAQAKLGFTRERSGNCVGRKQSNKMNTARAETATNGRNWERSL